MIVNGYEIKPGANLAAANLSGVFLFRTYLHGANLSEADQSVIMLRIYSWFKLIFVNFLIERSFINGLTFI